MQDVNDHLKLLDQLIAKLGGRDEGIQTEGPCPQLLEHLEAARFELIGSMPTEYALSLRQASDVVYCLPDRDLRDEFTRALDELRSAKKLVGAIPIARSEQLPD